MASIIETGKTVAKKTITSTPAKVAIALFIGALVMSIWAAIASSAKAKATN